MTDLPSLDTLLELTGADPLLIEIRDACRLLGRRLPIDGRGFTHNERTALLAAYQTITQLALRRQ